MSIHLDKYPKRVSGSCCVLGARWRKGRLVASDFTLVSGFTYAVSRRNMASEVV